MTTVDDSAISPRLAATFDPAGNGRQRFSATYGRYVAKVEQGPADLTAPAGRQTDIINIFNNQGIEDPDFIDKTVITHRTNLPVCTVNGSASRCQPFNPLKGEQPVEGVNFAKVDKFGQANAVEAYQLPRTYRFSIGMRF